MEPVIAQVTMTLRLISSHLLAQSPTGERIGAKFHGHLLVDGDDADTAVDREPLAGHMLSSVGSEQNGEPLKVLAVA